MASTRSTTPKEHGAWGVGGASLLTGALAARHWGWDTTLLLAAAVALLFARTAALALLRSRLSTEARNAHRRQALVAGAIAWAALLTLAAVDHLRWLPAWIAVGASLGGLDFWMAHRRQQRSVLAELAGMGALTWLAPTAYALGIGRLTPSALQLWLLAWLYFGLAVPYVKMFLAWRTGQQVARWQGAAAWSAVAATSLTVAGIHADALPWTTGVPFVLTSAKVLYGLLRERSHPPSFFFLGWRETALSLMFAICVGLGWSAR